MAPTTATAPVKASTKMNLRLETKLMSQLYIQPNECWIYTGGHDDYGYGWLEDNRTHVISFNCFKGQVPINMCVCHTCDNPSCFNPDHLYLGTKRNNIQDMWKSGRGIVPNTVGIMNGSAVLNEDDVLEIRKLYELGNYTQKELGVIYRVDNSTIWKIVHRKSWTHI